MAKLDILTYPHPILKQVAEEVPQIDEEAKRLSADMLETMYAAPGVGLAAPQIGKSIRMIVLDTRPKDEDTGELYIADDMTELEKKAQYPYTMINPVITQRSGKIKWEEGCLSLPGLSEEVERSAKITVEYFDLDGKKQSLEADSLLGVCIQHEIDHLNGKVFIENLSQLKFDRIRKQIKKYGYPEFEDDE